MNRLPGCGPPREIRVMCWRVLRIRVVACCLLWATVKIRFPCLPSRPGRNNRSALSGPQRVGGVRASHFIRLRWGISRRLEHGSVDASMRSSEWERPVKRDGQLAAGATDWVERLARRVPRWHGSVNRSGMEPSGLKTMLRPPISATLRGSCVLSSVLAADPSWMDFKCLGSVEKDMSDEMVYF